MNKCEKCGVENPDTAQYCKECGAPQSISKSANVIPFKQTFRELHLITKIVFYISAVAVSLFFVCLILTVHFEQKMKNVEANYRKKLNSSIEAIIKVDGISASELREIKSELCDRWQYAYRFNDVYDANEKKIKKQISVQDLNTLKELVDKYNKYNDIQNHYFDIEYPGAIALTALIASIASILVFSYFFIAFNLRWKQFKLKKPFLEVKEILTEYAFAQNVKYEKFNIRENSQGELKLKEKSLGNRGYYHLVADEDSKALLIGERNNTMDFIRTVFGKDVNFIEN